MAYCEVTDLLTGTIPTPTALNPTKFVSDAADEIDSKIGMIYATPVVITDTVAGQPNPVVRPVRLLLKRLNVHLASGRLIMAAAANMEDTQLHAYGWSLVKEATDTLTAIAAGELNLVGVEPAEGATASVTTPLISNLDAESNVEAFYDRIANPSYSFLRPYGGGFIGV